MKQFYLTFFVAFLFISCNSSKKMVANPSEIYGGWELMNLNGKDMSHSNAQAILGFSESDAQVSGKAGCNRFFGSFHISGNKLSFSQMGSTKMYCGAEANRIENEFFAMLSQVTNYKIDAQTLILFRNKKEIARLQSDGSVPEDLVGEWQLVEINGQVNSLADLYPNKMPNLVFKSKSANFSSYNGCNSMMGTYSGSDSTTLFHLSASTLMTCPGDGEQIYIDQLKQINTYRIDGNILILLKDDIPLLKFERGNTPR